VSTLPSRIGAYEVIKALGRGGMGSVFLARDPAIDRLVAIKLLREGLDTPELRERFAREARSAGRLRHPNIVTIFHVGEYDQQPFIVMEYIPGETLADIIKAELPLTVTRKMKIIEDLCRGLAYAHKSGIVHRDVKPANILVDSDGMVKILDFGIARIGRIGETGLTQFGMMMGTPNYMAPEQISPGLADHRSDVFAVGLVFYELLTYRRAFPGDGFSVLHRIMNSEPEPLEQVCPGLDPEIAAVLRRALEKEPDARYQDLGTMRTELTRIRLRLRATADETSDEGPITPLADSPEETTLPASAAAIVESLLREARASLAAEQFEKAIEQCKEVLARDPGNRMAVEIRATAIQQIDVARARELLRLARAQLDAGDAWAAFELVQKAMVMNLASDAAADAVHTELGTLKRAIEAAQERVNAVGHAVDQARDHLHGGALEAAMSAIAHALALSPDDGEAKAVRAEIEAAILERQRADDERRRSAYAATAAGIIQSARTAADQGEPARALAELATIRFDSEDVASPDLDRLRPEVAQLTASYQAQQQIAAARKALAEGQYPQAHEALAQARSFDASLPELDAVAKEIAARETADRLARERQELERLKNEVERSLTAGDVKAVEAALASIAGLDNSEPALPAYRAKLADLRSRKTAPAVDDGATVVVQPAASSRTAAPPVPQTEAARQEPPKAPPPSSALDVPAAASSSPAGAVAVGQKAPAIEPSAPAAGRQQAGAHPAAVPQPRTKAAVVWGLSAAAVLLLGAGVWLLTTGRTSKAPVQSAPPAAATVEQPGPPPAPPAPPPVAPESGPTPRREAAPPPAPPSAGVAANVASIHRRFSDSIARRDFTSALDVLQDPSAQGDPTIQRDLDQLVRATRRETAQAFERAQRSNGARNGEAEYRAGIARQSEAAELERRGRKTEAVRAFIAAVGFFSRAASAPPSSASTAETPRPSPPPVSQPPPAAAPSTPVPAAPSPPPTPTPTVEAARPEPTPSAPARGSAPEPPANPARTLAADRAAVTSVLDQYVAGYSRRDAEAIRRVWPSAPATVNFANVRSYDLKLTDVQIQVQGDVATVTCIRQLKVQAAAGKAQEASPRTTFTLRRGPSGWLIERVQ
jgi:ketosteroid isomerase-like protein/predicted Ser/Thr protein kinase